MPSREEADRRKSLGLCVVCGKNSQGVRRLRCDVCAEKQKKYSDKHRTPEERKRLRQERKAAGLCCGCYVVPAKENRTYCDGCLQINIDRAARRRAKLLSEGLCVKCAKHPPSPASNLCEQCFAKTKERETKRRKSIKDKGLCVTCKAEPVTPPYVRCQVCRQLQRDYQEQYYNRDAEITERRREYKQQYHQTNRDKRNAAAAERNRQLKAAVIAVYGGHCTCCGETGLPFLSLDHINGDGAHHRRSIGKAAGGNFYVWLTKNDYPMKDELQVLCHNCNVAKGTGECCPHQLARMPHPDQLSLFDFAPIPK